MEESNIMEITMQCALGIDKTSQNNLLVWLHM
jgi:hypothetical protein